MMEETLTIEPVEDETPEDYEDEEGIEEALEVTAEDDDDGSYVEPDYEDEPDGPDDIVGSIVIDTTLDPDDEQELPTEGDVETDVIDEVDEDDVVDPPSDETEDEEDPLSDGYNDVPIDDDDDDEPVIEQGTGTGEPPVVGGN